MARGEDALHRADHHGRLGVDDVVIAVLGDHAGGARGPREGLVAGAPRRLEIGVGMLPVGFIADEVIGGLAELSNLISTGGLKKNVFGAWRAASPRRAVADAAQIAT